MDKLTDDLKYRFKNGNVSRLVNLSLEGPYLAETSINKIASALRQNMPLSMYRASTYCKEVRYPDTLVCKVEINSKPFYASLITGQLFNPEGINVSHHHVRIVPKVKEKRISPKEAVRWIRECGKNFDSEYGRTAAYQI